MLRNTTGDTSRGLRSARWARLGGAVVAGLAMTLAMSGVAQADDPTATRTTLGGGKTVYLTNEDPAAAGRMTLTYEGAQPQIAYCIDFRHKTADDSYGPDTWDHTAIGTADLSKIKWILFHSYPSIGADKVAASAKDKGDATKFDEETLKNLVFAGTQAAIWHFSDKVVLDPEKNSDNPAEYDVIRDVYTYMVTKADAAPVVADPVPTLKIAPATIAATTGTKAGPYTVTSGGGDTTIIATGGKVVDKDGKAITTVKNGGQFWVTSDTVGTVNIKATGSGEIPVGRVFTYRPDPNERQKLIFAGVAGRNLEASAKATFEEAGPSLPVTGSNVVTAVAVGLVLLLGGAVVLMTIRRRKVTFTA